MADIGPLQDCCEDDQYAEDGFIVTSDGRVRCGTCMEDVFDYDALPPNAREHIQDYRDEPLPPKGFN